jgi:dGTPase
MLDWERLLSTTRRKELDGDAEPSGTGAGREDHERDFDRILFAAPTRRLADKTQVFPMEENDSVRTRLTHSHEVSNLARSFGIRLAFEYAESVFGKAHEKLAVKRRVPALLAAAGLAHDLGNPPFGHQGESSIQRWFRASHDAQQGPIIEEDFRDFDGNAQTFRLLTRLQVLNDDYGLNLTCGTLTALVKYPVIYGENKGKYKECGVFLAEKDIIEQVWNETGLGRGVRHPFAAVVEACDDIAYSVIDAEDTVKKACASFYDLMNWLETHANDDVSKEIVKNARERNKDLRSRNLSSKELNDVSMQFFRAIAISRMVEAATNVFVANIDALMSGNVDASFELIGASDCGRFCGAVKDFDFRFGFQHRDVVKLELEGNNYLHAVMDILWDSIPSHASQDLGPFAKFAYSTISENYRRVYEASPRNVRDKRQLVCDAVSGMTESFLIKTFKELKLLKDVS